jgi:hypothetical protein
VFCVIHLFDQIFSRLLPRSGSATLVTWLKALKFCSWPTGCPPFLPTPVTPRDLTAAVAVQLAPAGGNRGDQGVDCAPTAMAFVVPRITRRKLTALRS